MKREPHDILPADFRAELPAPARADPARLARELQLASRSPIVAALLAAVDSVLLVLNEERQIVAFGGGAASLSGSAALPGMRPGEALGCVNAQTEGGCGASPACRSCGALGAILEARRSGRPTVAECFLRSVAGGGAALEFAVRAAPLSLEGARFTVLSLRDISAEKRREALEEVFLHDVANTVQALRGWASRIGAPGADAARATERLDLLTRQLEREVRDHRDLVLAERGTLAPALQEVTAAELLRSVEAVFSSHAVSAGRRLLLECPEGDLALRTDPSLLVRVLANMVRNAFEATAPGGTVHLRAGPDLRPGEPPPGAVRFSVHNEGVMPPEVRHRVFVRSFSTKGGRGRGLGTHSMKLLGERHLGGHVSFDSSAEAGTTFWIRLPVDGPVAA